ncbi:MAG TPA: alpha/beta hydrolase [Coriobacteriia bacterium]
MSADRSVQPGESSPRIAHTGVAGLVPALRHLAAFAIVLGGLLWVAGWWTASSACWFLWLGIGAVAAVVAGSRRGIGLVAVATLAVYPVAALLGLERIAFEWLNWAVLTLVGGMVAGAGYALAFVAISRVAPAERRRAAARGGRALVVGAVALGLLGVVVWSGYSGYVGSNEMLGAPGEWPHCDTPMARFGWAYEAVNYDIADDARLAAGNPTMQDCPSQGAQAGSEVVTSDGVPIAAFYVPAANGADSTAPTIVIAPGWKSNKSEILKYAPFFHERFNLVLVDLRNGGRSGGDTTTWGVREQLDIRAIVDWLEREKHPAWIGGMGNSMGAATMTAAAANDERIRALILDSMHASIVATFGDGIANERNLPGYPSTWAMIALASLRSGEDLPAVDPQRLIARLGDRPVLLIHGTADVLDTPEHSAELNLAAARAAGVPVTLEYCEGGTHGKLVEACPGQWQAWVDGFLAGIPEIHVPAATR